MWDGQNFSKTAKNVLLEGTKLIADLPAKDGAYRERQTMELNDRISNEDATLIMI